MIIKATFLPPAPPLPHTTRLPCVSTLSALPMPPKPTPHTTVALAALEVDDQ